VGSVDDDDTAGQEASSPSTRNLARNDTKLRHRQPNPIHVTTSIRNAGGDLNNSENNPSIHPPREEKEGKGRGMD
jgi:hypothetical protein